ncbi:MAG: SCO6745 family protein, partial [Acidimicrobiales bacterium]
MADLRCSDHVHEASRRLRARAESIFGLVFYTPEARLGAHSLDRVQWYMAGRSAPLGPVTAAVANAVFGTFNPGLVHAGLDGVWAILSPEEIIAYRLVSAEAAMARFGPPDGGDLARAITLLSRATDAAEVAGHPLYAGLAALPLPDSAPGRLWRMCDFVREHRSDAHVNAWRSFGFDAVEICVLNELWRELAAGSVAVTDMAWTKADCEAATEHLTEEGLAAAGRITERGRAVREDIERTTSAQQASVVT